MQERTSARHGVRQWTQGLILALTCLAPWAFGSVEAWAELLLDAGVVLATLMVLAAGRRPGRLENLLSAPSIGLGGLALLAWLQSVPLPRPLDVRVGPSSMRQALSPAAAERVLGDLKARVPLPPWTLSIDPEASQIAAVRLAAAWLLFQSVLGLGAGPKFLWRLSLAATSNAAAMALFSITQSMTWTGKIYGYRASPIANAWRTGGPFVCHNHLAGYLNVCLGLAVGLLLAAGLPDHGARSFPRKRGSSAWLAYAAGLIVAGIIASHSRSGFVGMSIAGVGGVLIFRSTVQRAKLRLGAVAALAAVVLFAVGGWSHFQRLATLFDPGAYSDRVEIWDAALATWLGRPILGWGMGTFQVAASAAFRHDQGINFARAENEYLDLLVEGGVVGLGLAVMGLLGVVRLGLLASRASAARDRSLVAGAMLGLAALSVQSLADFSPHIPGVAATAVVLCATLCEIGQAERKCVIPIRPSRLGFATSCAVMVVLSLGVFVQACHLAQAESCLSMSGLPVPGASTPALVVREESRGALERKKLGLDAALQHRPDWSEGYLRLGTTLLGLYQSTAKEWVADEVKETSKAARLADPLWLHAAAHSGGPDNVTEFAREVAAQEPVRLYLAPAARAFLEARRCSPFMAATHAYLAELDYLLEGGDSSPVYAARAMRLAGGNGRILGLAAVAAAQVGDMWTAGRIFRRQIEVDESSWEAVADLASTFMPAELLLSHVIPVEGRWPIRFADRLFTGPEDNHFRSQFLRAALERLPNDDRVPKAERLRLEARARAGLGDDDNAGRLYEQALSLEPLNAEWRFEYVTWLSGRGELAKAYRQAVIGSQLRQDNGALRLAVVQLAGAAARDVTPPHTITGPVR